MPKPTSTPFTRTKILKRKRTNGSEGLGLLNFLDFYQHNGTYESNDFLEQMRRIVDFI
jgi:hypothetical protein